MGKQNRRWSSVLVVLLCGACTAEIGTVPAAGGGPPNGGGAGGDADGQLGADCDPAALGAAAPEWAVEIDTAAVNPFVVGAPATATVSGSVRATKGLAGVDVGGVPAVLDGDAFAAEVPVAPGLSKIAILARDAEGHERVGDRSLLSTPFLPEGQINPDAAAIILDDEALASMIEPFIEEVRNIDIAGEVMNQAGGLSQSGCEINLGNASTGEPGIRMFVGEGGVLSFEFTVPDVDVTFSGACDSVFFSATFNGRLRTDVVVRTTFSVPYTGACAPSPGHTYPTVELPGYQLDLDIQSGGGGFLGGGGGGLMGLLMPIVEAIMQGVVQDQMATQIAEVADEMIAEQATQFATFDAGGAFAFAGTDLEVGFCLTELGPADGQLRARVGLSAQGPGGREAPGAPLVEGPLPPAAPGFLWVDANLISQFMYSLWAAGSFTRDVEGMIDIGMIALIAPELGDRYCGDTPVTIRIDGLMPPLVHAAAPEAGDLFVELGDLQIQLLADGEMILGMAANINLTLELTPDGGALMPRITLTEVDSRVVSEPVADVPDDVVLGFVNSQVDAQVAALLGEEGIALPAVAGLTLIPTDVVAEPGGRFLKVTLAP